MRMKGDSNKVIFPYFGRYFFVVCRYYHGYLSLGDMSMKLPLHHLQEIPYLSLVLLCL